MTNMICAKDAGMHARFKPRFSRTAPFLDTVDELRVKSIDRACPLLFEFQVS